MSNGILIIKSVLATLAATAVVAYVVKRFGSLFVELAKQIVEPIAYYAQRAVSESMARRASLRAYSRTQLGRPEVRRLHVPGRWSTTLNINTVYVPLVLHGLGQREVKEPNDLWADDASRVIIIGDPGSGKTSFVKRMFLDSCLDASSSLDDRLPVILKLRDLGAVENKSTSRELGIWLLDELRGVVADVHGYQMGSLFDATLSSSGLLVLLDGLDEVRQDRFDNIAKAIVELSQELANQSPKNRLVLTMRSQYEQHVRHHFAEFFDATYSIRPFSSGDIYSFLAKWPFRRDPVAAANRIYGDLTDRPTLREMCSNPLVLAMYVANDQGGMGSDAPDSRTKFYDIVVEELLVARRGRQVGLSTKTAKSAVQDRRERVLGPLALENLYDADQPLNSISWAKAVELIRSTYELEDDFAAEDELRELCKETGIIGEERPGESLCFIHLTFAEFLAARECVRVRVEGWRELMEKQRQFSASPATSARLVEVIPFATALQQPVAQTDAIEDVWLSANLNVMSRCFLETRSYQHPRWLEFATAESESLASIEADRWDSAWLQRLHLFSVISTDEREWQALYGRPGSVDLEGLFLKLAGDSEGRLAFIFELYASSDPPAAFRLAHACGVDLLRDQPNLIVRSLAVPSFFAMAMEHVEAQPDRAVEWASVLAEAALAEQAVAVAAAARDSAALSRAIQSLMIPTSRRWDASAPKVVREFLGLPLAFRAEVPNFEHLRPSILTNAMTLATWQPVETSRSSFPRVRIAAGVVPPRARWLPRSATGNLARLIVGGVAFELFMGLVGVSLLATRWPTAFGVAPTGHGVNWPLVAIGLVGLFGSISFFMYVQFWDNMIAMYAILLNRPLGPDKAWRLWRGRAQRAGLLARMIGHDLVRACVWMDRQVKAGRTGRKIAHHMEKVYGSRTD